MRANVFERARGRVYKLLDFVNVQPDLGVAEVSAGCREVGIISADFRGWTSADGWRRDARRAARSRDIHWDLPRRAVARDGATHEAIDKPTR
jgi:hypothetical protein